MKSLAVLLVTLCAANAAVLLKDECAPGYFQCANGLCIPDQLVCDGVYDCVSGVDETNCSSVSTDSAEADDPVNECSEGSFTCDNGLCVPIDFVCDGVYNCVSGNDEANCGDPGTSDAPASESQD